MTLPKYLSPFDILWRNFLSQEERYNTFLESSINYPVDIYTTDDHLILEIACTGMDKSEIEVSIENDVLKIARNVDKKKKDETVYIHKGIARRSFNLGLKIDPKYDLEKGEAEFRNGLLVIKVPFAEQAKNKVISIK